MATSQIRWSAKGSSSSPLSSASVRSSPTRHTLKQAAQNSVFKAAKLAQLFRMGSKAKRKAGAAVCCSGFLLIASAYERIISFFYGCLGGIDIFKKSVKKKKKRVTIERGEDDGKDRN